MEACALSKRMGHLLKMIQSDARPQPTIPFHFLTKTQAAALSIPNSRTWGRADCHFAGLPGHRAPAFLADSAARTLARRSAGSGETL